MGILRILSFVRLPLRCHIEIFISGRAGIEIEGEKQNGGISDNFFRSKTACWAANALVNIPRSLGLSLPSVRGPGPGIMIVSVKICFEFPFQESPYHPLVTPLNLIIALVSRYGTDALCHFAQNSRLRARKAVFTLFAKDSRLKDESSRRILKDGRALRQNTSCCPATILAKFASSEHFSCLKRCFHLFR